MNDTETSIKNIYETIYIGEPHQLSIENVSNLLRLDVHYWNFSSEIVEYKRKYRLFFNENLSMQQQWQDFGHEMSHYFRDQSNQNVLRESFVDYCETKADYFAYHFCVPTFMLMKLKEVTVYDLMNLFNVEFDFALRRLEMYKNKIMERKIIYAGTYSKTW